MPDTTGRWTVARQVGQFTAAGLIALALVALATSWASQRVGEREAIRDARATALVKAQGRVEPVLTGALLRRSPAAVRRVARAVERDVLDRSLVRVKLWTRNGTILYSDEPRLEGDRFPLGTSELAALSTGQLDADISDLSEPENRFERDRGKLLEVYVPVTAPGGTHLLFEAYFRYAAVSSAGARIWRSFAPITIGALIALQLVQVPLAWSLARRLRQRQREREGLLHQALAASDTERRRIASDLHDGVVQDLAGVAYSLAGAARHDGLPSTSSSLLWSSASEVRDSIKTLRSLLVEIYPPNLFDEGLGSALTDLLARASNRGVIVTLDIRDLHEPLPTAVATLLYRTAQEALRNVLRHAQARSVSVSAASDDAVATLEIGDDGVGFPAHASDRSAASGHFGLRGLTDLVHDAGGTMSVTSEPDAGTCVRVEVPVR